MVNRIGIEEVFKDLEILNNFKLVTIIKIVIIQTIIDLKN